MLVFIIIYGGRFLAVATKTPYSPLVFLKNIQKYFYQVGPWLSWLFFYFRTKAGCKASTSTSLIVILTSTTEFTSANAKSTSLSYQTFFAHCNSHFGYLLGIAAQNSPHQSLPTCHSLTFQGGREDSLVVSATYYGVEYVDPKVLSNQANNPLSLMASLCNLKAWKSAPKTPLSPIPS